MTLGAVALLVLAGGVAAFVVLAPGGAPSKAAVGRGSSSAISRSVQTTGTEAPTTAPTAASSISATGTPWPDELGFLRRLDLILGDSSLGRAAVESAVNGTNTCSLTADSARALIEHGLANRQVLLSELSALTPPDDVTGRLRDDLFAALFAARDAAQEYATWIDDVYSAGCSGTAPQDSAYAAAVADSESATAAKQTFVSEYDPLAAADGLATWTEPDF